MDLNNKPVYTYSPESGYGVVDRAETERTNLRQAVSCLCFALLLSVFLSSFAKLAVSALLGLVFDIKILATGQIITSTALGYVITAVAYLIQLLVPVWALKLMAGGNINITPIGSTTLLRVAVGAPVLISLGIMGTLAANVVMSVFDSMGIHFAWPHSQVNTPVELVCSILILAVLPAIVEEYVFRGVVYGVLKPFGPRMAIIGSALLFALAHFNLLKFANALFIGLFLGYLVYRTGSMATGMALHFINNLLSICLSYIEQAVGITDTAWMLFYAAVCVMGIGAAIINAKKDQNAFSIEETAVCNTLTTKIKTACKTPGFVMMAVVVVFVMFNNGRIS